MKPTLNVRDLLRPHRATYAFGSLSLIVVNLCDTLLPLVLKFAIDDLVLARGLIPLWSIALFYIRAVLPVVRIHPTDARSVFRDPVH